MGVLGAGLTTRPVGAILAGGQATRLGRMPKGLLELGGRRIIDRVAEALAPETSELLVVTNALDASAWLRDARVVHDVLEGGGSAAGVHAALRAAAAPVIVVAWDLPFVTRGVCAQLAAAGDERTADAVVFEGANPGTLEPLCAWYAPAAADAIERTWNEGDRSLYGLLGRVRTVTIPASRAPRQGPPVFFNVNTEEDLVRARVLAAQAGDVDAGPA